jgi:ABC-2 type transport system permease protein
MIMLLSIARYEFRYMFFSLPTLIISCLLFGLAFLFTANGIEFQGTARGGNVYINSGYIIAKFIIMLSVLATFIIPTYIGGAVLKDRENHFDGILFSTPLTKKGYIFGRFIGGFSALTLILATVPIGMFIGTFWPWAVPETFTANVASHYLTAFWGYMMPSVFAMSALIFAVALLFRSMFYCYFAALAMVILFITVDVSTAISGLWDPFLGNIFAEESQYWTAAERNNNYLGFSELILGNRLLWITIALSVFTLAYRLFSFTIVAKVAKENPTKALADGKLKAAVDIHISVSPQWSAITHLQQLAYRTKFEMLSVLKSTPFIILMTFSFFLLFFALIGRETLYDVNTYPLTRILLSSIQGALTGALMVVLAFYSAEIIWRERSCKFNEIIDAMPTPNWVFAVSKIAALALIMHAIVLLGIIIAIALQIFSGYDDFQLGNYIGRGLIYYTTAYVYLAVLSCLFQVLASNRMLGMLFFVIFMLILTMSRDILGVEHVLLSYGLPDMYAPLSDMNNDSRLAIGGKWLRLYWGSIAGFLLIVTYMFWPRGLVQSFKFRCRQLRTFKSKGLTFTSLALLTVLVSSGSFIFYNTNSLNAYWTMTDIEQFKVDYEQKYRQYENLPMPRIVDVKMDVDIYPYKRRVEARSTQVLQNKTSQEISTIHLVFPIKAEVISVALEGAIQQSVDERFGYYIFELNQPLLPGGKRTLSFETLIQQQGFENSRQDITLVRNGSFISNRQLTPRVGFYPGLMISDSRKRSDYELTPLPRMPKLTDTDSHSNNYVSHDSDFVNFETTVSTVKGQQAIAPGYLVKEWQQEKRSYFHYKMDKPMMNYYAYLSADYEVKRDSWNSIDIEVHYHKAHDYNVDRMITSAKDSLAYFSEAFGEYQYRQLRILEFPSYKTSATAYPNTIGFSESIGFVVDTSDTQKIDLPYYVTAHEVAHQWWAHQVMAADAQGGTMLVETLAQYSALLVMEQKYGKHQLRKFLKYELDKYLRGRTKDSEGELPLYKVEDQPYIHYRKGALVMYALRDYVGEQTVNRALKRLVKNHAFKSAPYALSTDFIGYLKEAAGREHHSLIEDLFEKITFFDMKASQSEVTELADGRFKVTLDVDVAKYYEDAIGNKTEVPFNFSVDIGLFVQEPSTRGYGEIDVIIMEKHSLHSGQTTLEFIVDKKPKFAGVDPYNKLIDRDSNDNLTEVEVF